MTVENACVRALLFSGLCNLLLQRLFKVEDGQFEREYSRLYTSIVGSIVLLMLLGGVVFFIALLRSLFTER